MSLENVDLTSDLTNGTDSGAPLDNSAAPAAPKTDNSEQNGGTRQAGSEDVPTDTRSLLNKALKGELKPGDADRTRGPDGKFIEKPKEGAVTDPNVAQTATGTEAPKDAANASDPNSQQQTTGAAELPKPNLSADETAALNSVPEAMRSHLFTAIQAREAAYYNVARQAQQLAERVRGYDSVAQMIEPRRQAWAVNGVTPEAALNQLFALSDFAERDPEQFLQYFAGQRNIDLAQLSREVPAVPPEIQQLRQQVQHLTGQVQNGQTQQQQQHIASIASQVNQFAEAADTQGNKLRPYWGEVASDIQAMIPTIRQTNPNLDMPSILQTAYDRAVWANPSTRAKQLQAQEAARLAEAGKRAAEARSAGSSVTGAPAGEGARTEPKADTVGEALRAAIARHS